ncbi:hypothetical protein GCM10027515_14390 [Schumannella luteola]|uniref:alpha-L-rhamnosidase n=1 Tax=Schumannella luteola TaxID=472059 RepID=A0A852YL12_9MICO|nr:hypothetical protein [Schumannella luteola]
MTHRQSPPRRRVPVAPTRTITALLVTASLALTSLGGAAAASAEPAAPAVALERLQVEHSTEPIGVDLAHPRLSWVIAAPSARDVVQQSYRVVVDGPSGVAWDSGVVASSASTEIAYAGAALDAATRYDWSVEVVTSAGSARGESTFRTGLHDDADWGGADWIGNPRTPKSDRVTVDGANWIWTPEAAGNPPAEDRAFRRTLTSPNGRDAVSAEIVITADDSYTLWVDGTQVGATEPVENGWQQSRSYPVDLKKTGSVVAVRTTNGPNSPAGLIAAIRVTYDDGSTADIMTDASWRGSKQIPAGFEKPGFDDADWAAVNVIAPYGQGAWGSGVRAPADPAAPAPLLRTEFVLDGTPANATLFFAAGGYADFRLNGAPASDHLLAPGFTDYDDTVQYDAIDVTEQLVAGRNALSVELGRGFYGMTGGNVWNWDSPTWHDEPTVRAVLRIQNADGSTQDVVTDDSWRRHDGPTRFDDLYGGELYDARTELPGADTAGYDDGAWKKAAKVAGPKGELVHQRQQPIRVTEELPAASMTQPKPGIWVVKFPRVLAGNVKIAAEAPAGTQLELRYAEKLRADGTVNQDNNGGFAAGFQTDRYVFAGARPETWAARFSYKGFQYVQVTGWPGSEQPPLSAFTAQLLHSDTAVTSTFDSGSATMNGTHQAVVNTLLNNLHGIPTDTPMFEKNGWTGDAAVGAEMFLMNLDSQELFAKWMRDVDESRLPDGSPMVIAPSSKNWGDWGVVPPWHMAFLEVPWQLNRYGGDRQVLTGLYDDMKKYVDLEYSRSPGGLANSRLGDWVAPEASPAGGDPQEDKRVSATATLYRMLTLMGRMADLTGHAADAATFQERAGVVQKAFDHEFWDAAAGYYRGVGDNGYRQTHNVLAVAYGLPLSAEQAQKAADSIAVDVRARGMHLNTGVLGTKNLLPVLTDYGHADVAYALAEQTSYPSWGYMLANGATTMWEHWSTDARSLGHYFLGTADDWFFHDVAGITPGDETGWRDLSIAPKVTRTGLDHASASLQTPFGTVASSWKVGADGLTLDARVPVGSTATVRIPASGLAAVTESGTPVADAAGVRAAAMDGGDLVLQVGSGSYSFHVAENRGLAIASATATPSSIEPGSPTSVTAVVRNDGVASATGRLEIDAPEGWTVGTGATVTLAPGESRELRLPVLSPVDAPVASRQVALTTRFATADGLPPQRDVAVTVAIAAGADGALDHVDLGDDASEQAHALTASASSGTNTEAGLTRRYAGHLADFSQFAFDLAAKAGQPLLLRSIETYDRSQTKRYRILVDGEAVHTRQNARATGAGTETFQVLVPADRVKGDTVRVTFQNLDDHSYYDPSIADVWSLPAPVDASAPVVSSSTTPAAPDGEAGWFRTTPVTVAIAGDDDRPGDVALRVGVDGAGASDYSDPIVFDADGRHTLDITATDAAGNTAEQRLEVPIDGTAPVTTATVSTGSPVAARTARAAGASGAAGAAGDAGVSAMAAVAPAADAASAVVDLAAADATSGVASTWYRIAGGTWTPGVRAVVTTSGDSLVEFRSVDAAGNVETAGSVTVRVVVPTDPGGPGLPGQPGGPGDPGTAPGGVGSEAGGVGSGSAAGSGRIGGLAASGVDSPPLGLGLGLLALGLMAVLRSRVRRRARVTA